MKLKIQNFQVTELRLSNPENKEIKKVSLSLQVGQFKEQDTPDSFLIAFKIQLITEEYELYLVMEFKFEADCKISDEFMRGPFPKINAPAIAYPYVRAYISNLTMQSGYRAIMLPSINFVEYAKEHFSDNSPNS